MARWFRDVASGQRETDSGPPRPESGDDAHAHGLGFAAALEQHRRFKARLARFVAGDADASMRYEDVLRDDRCELGRWLHGEAQARFGGLAEFEELETHHAEFHAAAAKAVALVQAGSRAAARNLLEGGEYARASGKVVRALARLFVKIGDSPSRAA